MPRIDPHLMNSVFYIYPSEQAAQDRRSEGGTGFFITTTDSSCDFFFQYAVTTNHCVPRDQKHVWITLNTSDSQCSPPIRTSIDDWLQHPSGDDVAALWVEPDTLPLVGSVSHTDFLTPHLITQYNIGPGDDVFMIGRFSGFQGQAQNLPSVRFGNISLSPTETVRRLDGGQQEAYLVEMRSLSGYSGSPVFVSVLRNFHRYVDHPPLPLIGGHDPIWLLGIDFGHIAHWSPVLDRTTGKPLTEPLFVNLNSGMACVLPAEKLIELLNHPTFVASRESYAQARLTPP